MYSDKKYRSSRVVNIHFYVVTKRFFTNFGVCLFGTVNRLLALGFGRDSLECCDAAAVISLIAGVLN